MTKQRESKLSGKILDELRKNGVFCFKVHGGPTMMVGLPDIIACVDGKFVGLETKMPETRNNTSAMQKHVHQLIKLAGGIAVVVCSVPEAMAAVDKIRGGIADAEILGLIQELELMKMRRTAPHDRPTQTVRDRQEGEINGLNMAIRLLKGKL